MKKYKKIYIEITNICNLNCSFCSIDNRKKETISIENFEKVLSKINDHTDYIYLHVKGEPLLHKKLNKILDLCEKYNKKVNITTNGTLIKEKTTELLHPIVRQINISLHSENKKDNYLEEIFKSVDNLENKIIIYRFWTMNNGRLNEKSTEIVDKIKKYYDLSPEIVDKIKIENNIKLRESLYIDKKNEFIWPNLHNDYLNELGTCYALKDQIAILVDGTVVPCCLDSDGVINLGNIYEQTLEEIINSKRYQDMKIGFQNHQVSEELCKHCSFKDQLQVNQNNQYQPQ